jgi:hypothetical protein
MKTNLPTLRHAERHSIRVRALVHCRGRFQTISIVDFSSGGLRLEGAFGIAAREKISVELLSGDLLEATVAWSIGSQLGVQFVECLTSAHPALMTLNRLGTKSHRLALRAANLAAS